MQKKILIGLLIVLIVIQFIKPSKNQSTNISENDISKVYSLPPNVHEVLVKKCYDCHSNNTTYPWYYNIQPVAWWMNNHIVDGKRHLDFSEFKTYSAKKANHKLEELSDAVTNAWMPLDSYLWIHKEAKLTTEEAVAINGWISSLGVQTAKKE